MYATVVLTCVVCCVLVAAGQGGEETKALPTTENPMPDPIIVTVSGQFRGCWMQTRRGRRFEAYRGIRYAEPPVGELRFQPPKLILSYADIVDASKDGPGCPRYAPPGLPADEDCLRLNVYTPGHIPDDFLPVIVYIHIGSFYTGSSRSEIIGPQYLLDRNVVLVTINYRLGSLGFLALGNMLAPGNNGFKDQVAALRWVQRNIASFGGDPNLVTITGCSAGSISVMLHMISPMSNGMFQRAISMSGSPTSKVASPPDRIDLAIKQARISNCPEDNTTALYECLKTKSWQEIAASLDGFFEFGQDPLGPWQVIEPDFGQERFLTKDPMVSIREGRMHSVPFIVGRISDNFYNEATTVLQNKTLRDTMNAEWDRVAPIAFLLPRNETSDRLARLRQAYLGDKPLADDDVTAEGLARLYADAIIKFPVHRMANLMCRHSKYPVYYFEFAYVGNQSHHENPEAKKTVHAMRHYILLYLFPTSYAFPTIDVTDTEDSKMVDKMTAIWYNFAKYGDPHGRRSESVLSVVGRLDRMVVEQLSSLSWPRMTPEQRSYLRVHKQFTVAQNLDEDRLRVWEELYPIQY